MDFMVAIPLIVLFAGLDHLWGSDIRIVDRSGHSIGTVFAILTGMVLYFILGLPAALLAVLWAPYRSIPFFNGSQAPVEADEIVSAVIRHLPPILYAGVISTWSDISPLRFMAAFGVYLVFAVGLAAFNGRTQGKNNGFVEAARGAIYGLAIAFSCT